MSIWWKKDLKPLERIGTPLQCPLRGRQHTRYQKCQSPHLKIVKNKNVNDQDIGKWKNDALLWTIRWDIVVEKKANHRLHGFIEYASTNKLVDTHTYIPCSVPLAVATVGQVAPPSADRYIWPVVATATKYVIPPKTKKSKWNEMNRNEM